VFQTTVENCWSIILSCRIASPYYISICSSVTAKSGHFEQMLKCANLTECCLAIRINFKFLFVKYDVILSLSVTLCNMPTFEFPKVG